MWMLPVGGACPIVFLLIPTATPFASVIGMSTTTPTPIYVLALTLLVSSIARIVMVV